MAEDEANSNDSKRRGAPHLFLVHAFLYWEKGGELVVLQWTQVPLYTIYTPEPETIQPGLKIHKGETERLYLQPYTIQPGLKIHKGETERLIHYTFSYTTIQPGLKIHKGETEKLIHYTFSYTTIQPGLKIHKGETERLIHYTFSCTTIQPGLKIHTGETEKLIYYIFSHTPYSQGSRSTRGRQRNSFTISSAIHHTTRAQDPHGGDRETHLLYLRPYNHTTRAQDPQEERHYTISHTSIQPFNRGTGFTGGR
jgi:hypothetical protein